MPDHSKPAIIYELSCSFCHGGVGNGHGDEARRLRIPPEDLTAIRSTQPYLYHLLRRGVPGTPMPVFDYYTSDELNRLIDFLHRLGLRDKPEPLPVAVTPAMQDVANRVFQYICADCHGQNGRGSAPSAASLLPQPPDFTRFTVSPKRAIRIIAFGYPGTGMPAFSGFPEELRWGLASTINSLYEIKPD